MSVELFRNTESCKRFSKRERERESVFFFSKRGEGCELNTFLSAIETRHSSSGRMNIGSGSELLVGQTLSTWSSPCCCPIADRWWSEFEELKNGKCDFQKRTTGFQPKSPRETESGQLRGSEFKKTKSDFGAGDLFVVWIRKEATWKRAKELSCYGWYMDASAGRYDRENIKKRSGTVRSEGSILEAGSFWFLKNFHSNLESYRWVNDRESLQSLSIFFVG